jgi:carbonic anhydrase/acetyltransferase-like protein (isoleucine patch superfamily)
MYQRLTPCASHIRLQVTIGHGALLTSCTVGDRSLIGQGAVVQEGCEIGSNSIVAAGAVVLPGATRWLLLFV